MPTLNIVKARLREPERGAIRSTQTLEFGGIKASETIDKVHKPEEFEIASEPSPPIDRISVILASQLSSPFSGAVHVSEAVSALESLSDTGQEDSVQPEPIEKESEVTDADKVTSDSRNIATTAPLDEKEIAACAMYNDQIASILENQLTSSFIEKSSSYAPDAGRISPKGGGYTIQVAS